MRKWYLPMTVMGIGGLGLLLVSDRGRKILTQVADKVWRAPEQLLDWNDAVQRELDRIQMALNQVADSLETAQ